MARQTRALQAAAVKRNERECQAMMMRIQEYLEVEKRHAEHQ
jgi:hypothetical protein